jgi:hypothetical protein
LLSRDSGQSCVIKRKEGGEMMESIKGFIKSLQSHDNLWNVLMAVVIFVLGWIACKMVGGIVGALLRKIRLDDKINSEETKTPIKVEAIIQKFVYYILLVYVLLLALDKLEIRDVLRPVETMFTKFFGMIPNIIAAVLIAFMGYILAKIISSIVRAASTGFDPLVNKAGLSEKLTISKLLGQLVFIFIFIPIVISSLNVLHIEAISKPAISMLEELSTAIPNIIAAALIIIVFYIFGRLVTNFIAELLKNFGADDLPKKIGAAGIFGKKSFSVFCGNLVFFFIMLSASIAAVGKLEMPNISGILTDLLNFAGKVVLGLIVLALGNFIAVFAHDRLSASTKGGIYPLIVKYAILSFVLAMGLHTMGIAPDIVKMAFMFIFGTLALTIILAFGLGGREAAGKAMEKLLAKIDK